MKKYLQLLASTSLLCALISPSLSAAELTVEVSNIQQFQGSLYISLYKD